MGANDQTQDARISEDVEEIDNGSSRIVRGAVKDATTEQNQPPAQPANEMLEQGEPILEYANEPLLPLAEACAPLADILHDLDFYVKMALDETPQPPLDNLTIDESAAIRLYTIEWSDGHRSLYSDA